MATPAPTQPQKFGCYVGNIDSSVPLDTIRQVFAQCGTIVDASLNGRDTDPYRFGFIDFGNEADRERALKFNGVVLAGRPLKVGVSKGNVNKPVNGEGGSGGGSGGPSGHGGGGGGSGPHHHHSHHRQDAASAEAASALALLVNSGAIDLSRLTPEQQRTLTGALLSNSAAASGGSGHPAPPTGGIVIPSPMTSMVPPMGTMPHMGHPGMMHHHHGGGNPYGGMGMGYGMGGMPMMGGPMGGPMGGMGMGMGMNRGRGPYQRPPLPTPNPPPSEEVLMLRQAQRKTFFDVIVKEADKYKERRVKKRERSNSSGSGSDRSSASSEKSKEAKRPDEAPADNRDEL